jgi:hypothetical protein
MASWIDCFEIVYERANKANQWILVNVITLFSGARLCTEMCTGDMKCAPNQPNWTNQQEAFSMKSPAHNALLATRKTHH